MDQINFGTDGWRDIIADRYTFDNVSRVAQAYADYLTERKTPSVVIGYDTRFNGELFAMRVAEVMAANGLETRLSKSFLPTPVLSFAVKHYGAGGGIMLTASHNSAEYNGFKLKGAYGGTATQEIYQDVSARVAQTPHEAVAVYDSSAHGYDRFDIRKPYYAALAELVDVETIRSFRGTLVHDAMGGAAAGWLKGFFKYIKHPLEVHEVHAVPNPTFYGVNPEPLSANLASTIAVMQQGEAVFATATDGDGDRLGAVTPGGDFFNSHQIFAVLLDLLQRKGGEGTVVKTFTVSRLIERLAARRGLPVKETPVGFKYIVDAMLTEDVLVGGEESGGIGVAGHLPERDGVANSLLLLEAVITAGCSLKEIFAGLEREADWRHAYDRLDVRLAGQGLKERVMTALDDAPEQFAGYKVSSVERTDGVKLNLADEAWILFRASGTEPLLRIYCEAPSESAVQAILSRAEAFIAEG